MPLIPGHAFCVILRLFCEQQADAFLDLCQRLVGDVGRVLGTLAHLLFEISAVLHEAREVLADRAQLIGDALADDSLEVAVALAGELSLNLCHRLARDGRVDRHEVADAWLFIRVKAHAGLAVRDGTLEFLEDGLLIIEDRDRGLRVRVRLAHLARRILQAHDARAGLREVALRQLEYLAVRVVEARGDIARELEVLRLVSADRHVIRLIEQDVACHQGRVGEKAGIDVVRVLGRLVLELRHARELAEL